MNKYNNRITREADFRIFSNNVEHFMTTIVANDTKHQTIANYTGFYVVPGGANGGLDGRAVDVFYGKRPVGTDFYIPGQRRICVEHGSGLQYRLNDDASVICILYLAGSTNSKPAINGFVLAHISTPSVLTGVPTIQRHFRYLQSVNEMSRIDGTPSVIDQLRFMWLKVSRIQLVDGQAKSPLYIRLIKWVLAPLITGGLLIEHFLLK